MPGVNALQKGDQVAAGAHDYVLPVIQGAAGSGVPEGKGAPAQGVAGFQQGYRPAGFGQPGGGGDAGDAASDDQGAAAAHRSRGPVSQARAISPSLAVLLNPMRSRNTSQPAASMRSRTPP